MRKLSSIRKAALIAALACAAPLAAAIVLKPANVSVAVAKSGLTVTPNQAWSKLNRPGKNAESWTLDGLALNDVTFYGGIADKTTLFRAADKKNAPLPTFSRTMLPPDIAQMFESSYRIALQSSLMQVDSIEPATFAGNPGFRFTYSFAVQDEVKRKGEARGAIIGDKLYMMTFEAPVIHYFDRDIGAFRAMADSARIAAGKKK